MGLDAAALPEDAIAQFEKIAQSQIDAINIRDLSPNAPAWRNCSPNFQCQRGGIRSDQQKRWVDLQGLLDDLKEITTSCPDYRVKLSECSVQAGATAHVATFYAPHAVTGDPPGLTMCVVGVMAFEKIAGEWKLTKYWATMGPSAIDAMIQV